MKFDVSVVFVCLLFVCLLVKRFSGDLVLKTVQRIREPASCIYNGRTTNGSWSAAMLSLSSSVRRVAGEAALGR